MVRVGSVRVGQADPEGEWEFFVVVLPVIPAGLVIFLTVRALGRLDEVQKRTQMQALGFSMAATGLLTFAYGFLEGVGLRHLNPTFVLPLGGGLWGVGCVVLNPWVRFAR